MQRVLYFGHIWAVFTNIAYYYSEVQSKKVVLFVNILITYCWILRHQ